MDAEYANGCISVNALSCLSKHNQGSKTHLMTLGERLKAARRYANLDTQEQLAKKSGVSQQTISKIERGLVDSSGYVVHLAKACGVRPEWLAMEDGEMVDGLYVDDERIKRGVEILEQLKSEHRLDDALELLNSVVKFSQKKTSQ